MPTNEYDELLQANEYDQQIAQDEGRKALRASMVPALASKPDTFAEAKRLGVAGGLPAEVVERNLDTVRKQAQVNDYDRLLVESPALAKHLTDKPDFAKIAHDDTENLSLVERASTSFKRGFTGTVRGTDAMALEESAQMLNVLDRLQRGEFADQAALEQASPYGRFFTGLAPEQFPSARQQLEQRFIENAAEFAIRTGKIRGLPASEEYQRFQQMGRDYGFLEGAIPAAVFQPSVLLDIVSESLGALTPSLPLIVGGGVAGGVPGLAAATGASSGFTEFSNSLPAVFEELGVDLTDQAAVRAAVRTPEFMEKARAAAIKSGVIGLFDAATAGVGALRLRPSAGGNLAAQTAVQGTGGAAGEATGSVASGQEIDPSSVVAEAVGEVPTAVIDAGVLAGRRQMERRQRAQAAEQDAQVLTQIGELAKASKVAQRDPASFQAFVDAAAAEGPVQDVYVDAKVLAETLQQDGLAELAQAAPTAAAQIPEALASGGSVRIPLSEYATGIAATDLNARLLPHLKTDPAGMSQAEAQEYMQGEAAQFKAEAEQILAEKQNDDAWTQSAAKVEGTVLEQLTAAKRFTADVNKAYAALTRDFYVTTAARVGVTPEELYAKYPLQVRAESVAGEGLEQAQVVSLEDKAIEQRFAEKMATTPAEEIEAEYNALPDSKGGRVLNTDVARELSPDYLANRTKSSAVHEPASSFIKKLYAKKLAEEPGPDQIPTVLFTAGGTGAGKTTAVSAIPEVRTLADEAQLVYDTNMNSYDSAKQKIEQALDAGKDVAVVLIVRDPVEALRQALGRATRQEEEFGSGRTVPLKDHIETHVGAIETIKRLAQEYADDPRVAITAIDNNGGKGKAKIIDLADAKDLAYNDVAPAVEAALEQEREQGRISQAVYEGFAARADTRGAGAGGSVQEGDRAGSRGPAEPQRADQGDGEETLTQGTRTASRGSFNPATKTIALLKNADLSTFLHESAHFYLEVLADLAAQPNSPVAGDMQAVLDWFGVKDLATWQGMSLNQKRPHHEKFARGFEAYLFDGEAPSVEIKGVFARFRTWLVNVYKSLADLNVELSDEVRGVFDRLLASEQQIQEAEAAAGAMPLFTEPAPGMTPEEFAGYQALGAEATSEAVNDLQRRSLRDMQWLADARGRKLKSLQHDAAGKRRAVRKEVEAEVAAQPVYAAMRFLKTGELPDGRSLDVHRLQVSAIEEMYPEGRPSYDWKDLGKGAGGMTGVNGISPDAAAELLGFTSGDHLIRDLLAAQPQEQVVEGMTDQRMLERYGDLATPEALQRAANEAVHNDARMRFVTAELNALAKATGGRKVLAKAAKDFAAAIVARKRVRDIKPSQYTVAEARAAQAAEKALKGGNLTEAAVEKRNQLVNGYAGRAAHEAVDEVDKGVRYLRKFAGPTSLDPEYAEQIHALLGRFDLRRITNREADRRATLAKWVEAQQALGFEPAIDEALLDEAARKPYREMTVEQFRGLVDTVRNIEHLGRLKKKLLTAQGEREFAEAVDTAAASIRANAKGKKPVKLESNTALDRAAEGVGEFFAMHRKVASLLREMDGFKDGGVLWELLMRPLNAASNAEASMREKATLALDKVFKKDIVTGLRQKLYIPEIGASLSKEGRLAVALNWGNADNRQRVMEGDGWAPQQVQAILNTLTKQEWDFVQGVWDYVDSFWPEIAAKEKRVSGVAPEKVVALPVETPFGSYRGGYYPIKYDPRRSSKAESHTLAETVKQSMQGLYTRATTRRGHTKARVEEVTGRPVRKDLGVVFEHVTQVAHDLQFHEYLIDANRLLRADAIDSAIREHYGPEVLRQLKNALTDIAAGDVPAQNTFERAVNHVRTGATIAGLGWNLTTALIQPIGLTQSMVRIGPKWVGRGLARWMRDASTMENTAAWIDGKSDFMRLRGKTLQREISEIRNKVSGKDSAIEQSFFYLIQKMQRVVDIPTWLGAYEKAMEADPDEARAIALADQAVLDAQGGGQIKDLAGIQRGGPLMKLWTNFYSFFNTTYNLAVERTKATKFNDPLQVGRLAVDYLLLFTVPAAMGAALRTALKPGEDWDDLPERAAREHLNYLFGLMVGLRELGSAINGFAGYTGPAGLRFFAEISKLYKEVTDGEVDEAALKALNNVTGILFHYPAGQVQRTVEGAVALVEGDTKNPTALVAGAPR